MIYQSQIQFNKGLRIPVSTDFRDFLFWQVKKQTFNCIKLMVPKYAPHVSIILPKIHEPYLESSRKFCGEPIEFEYKDIYKGGSYFNGFYLRVKCDRADEIKKELKIIETGFLGYHMTICSDKWSKKL